MEYTIDSDEEFLRVKVSGRNTDSPPSDVCAAVLKESTKLARERILIELDQEFALSTTSQYSLITRLPEAGLTPRHRIALVHRRPEMQQANQFIDVIAGNRGLMVRNFPSVQNAEAWLREEAGGIGA
jgi:hypothetical protein